MARVRVAVVLPHGFAPASRSGAADATPYGYGLVADRVDLRWSADRAEGRTRRVVRLAVRRVLGFDLLHVWHNRALLRQVDAVWTHTELEHLAVALLLPRRAGARPVVIGQSVWLWDGWAGAGPLKRLVHARLLRRLTVETTHSALNRDRSRRAVPGRQVVLLPFGTSVPHVTRVAPSTRPPAPLVVAPGNDRDRDWPLLGRCAELRPDLRFAIVSGHPAARALPPAPNLEVVRDPGRLPALYARAAAVVVPLRPNLHASGCTVAIEALGLGLPLVVTRTGGLDDYLDGSGAVLVAPGDAAALAAGIDGALAGAAPVPGWGRRHGLRQQDFAERHVLLTEALLAGRDPDDAVSRFAPVDRRRPPQL